MDDRTRRNRPPMWRYLILLTICGLTFFLALTVAIRGSTAANRTIGVIGCLCILGITGWAVYRIVTHSPTGRGMSRLGGWILLAAGVLTLGLQLRKLFTDSGASLGMAIAGAGWAAFGAAVLIGNATRQGGRTD